MRQCLNTVEYFQTGARQLKSCIKSWLAKQAFWQVHIPHPEEVRHPRYKERKHNEQHQFDLVYVPHNFLKGTHKYILAGADAASRCKVARVLKTRKTSEVALMLEDIFRKGRVPKYPKVFQCKNGFWFKSNTSKLPGKCNVSIQRTASKYKHTDAAFVEAFHKEFSKQLFKPFDAQDFQDWKIVKKWKSVDNQVKNLKAR